MTNMKSSEMYVWKVKDVSGREHMRFYNIVLNEKFEHDKSLPASLFSG